ncbi:cobalt-precorrin 5A hydrolase [Dethiosulfatarculus sandiegensis]|uniref:Cobalamin biosynthesis protein CbiG n=1 Tax=Dethiosulfatarculus sandiegensis TaxID=1429043 RepID=A0A0D2GBA0_9BACT|nr:cobalamin biosynthesis protein [Dethiosulfatarculus sandiegensis]KIX12152.1 cobalamin biosynthesis protein CbiG [Dethiosulfatarculus sandiegensis]
MADWQGRAAIYALNQKGAQKARELAGKLNAARVCLPERLASSEDGEAGFLNFSACLEENFQAYDGHICFCASGIVVRALVGLLEKKDKDPAVVVCDHRGAFAVSLVSGHLGGANDLARETARLLGGQAVITTATDSAGLPSLEVVAREQGLYVENLSALAKVSTSLLEDRQVGLHDPFNWLKPALKKHAHLFKEADLESQDEPRVWVDITSLDPIPPNWLVMRPPCLFVGVGCNKGTGSQEMLELLRETLSEHALSPDCMAGLASVELKQYEVGLWRLAGELGLGIRFFTIDELNAVQTPNPSVMAQKHVGAKSVCEAASILASGRGTLLATKRKTKNATVAVALRESPQASSM